MKSKKLKVNKSKLEFGEHKLSPCHSERALATEESLLTISASTGEILRFAQNDRVVFWFCFYVLVILRERSDRRISTCD